MSNFILMAVCLVAGLWLRRSGRLQESGCAGINALIINVSLPALTLAHLHRFAFSADHLAPLVMPWVLFMLGMAFFWVVGRYLELNRATTGALMLVAGFGNTSFVGLPMIEALHGREGLGLGMAIDQFGTYLALSTLGLLVAAIYASTERPTASTVAQRMLRFPPFVAIVVALLLQPVTIPESVHTVLLRLGDTMAPLAFLWVGAQFDPKHLTEYRRPLVWGLGWKLMACPLMVIALVMAHGGMEPSVEQVTVIQSAMPPMIGAAAVAVQSGLAPRLVAALIGLGIPLGLATSSAWFLAYGLMG